MADADPKNPRVGDEYLSARDGMPAFVITEVFTGPCRSHPRAQDHVHHVSPNGYVRWDHTSSLSVSSYVFPGIAAPLPPAPVPAPAPGSVGLAFPNYKGPLLTDWLPKNKEPAKKKRQVSTNGRDWVDYDRLDDSDPFENYKHRREI